MKKREITATGMINNNGGLQMYMGELNQFFAMHKGSRIIARFIVASPGSSEALKGYYFNYVVPTFRTGIWEAGERLTDEQTERRLRELSPVMYEQIPNIETGEYETRLRTIAELSNAELIEHIEHLKQIAAEEYSIFIDDPKSISTPAHDALEDVKACKRCIPVLVENGIIELKPKEYPAEQLKFNPEPEPAKTKKVKREVLVHDPKPKLAPDAEPENKVAKLLNETDF